MSTPSISNSRRVCRSALGTRMSAASYHSQPPRRVCPSALGTCMAMFGALACRAARPEVTSTTPLAPTVVFEPTQTPTERLARVEALLADPAHVATEALADARRELDALKAEFAADATNLARVAAAKATAERVHAERLLVDAKAAAALGGDASDRAALARYTQAEDELRELLDAAFQGDDAQARKHFTDLYRQALAESDAQVERIFTPEVIERLPWLDLLSGAQQQHWAASVCAGFAHHFDNGALHIVGPAKGAAGDGILSIGDREQWRDFVLEMEFAIAKGGMTLCFRLGKLVDRSVETWTLTVEGDDALSTLRPYTARASFIGSSATLALDDPDFEPIQARIHWTMNRLGALGIVVPEGAELMFTRLRIKVLR